MPPGGAAPPAAGAGDAGGGEGREVVIGPLSLTAPEGWIRKPSTQFTLAVFELPRAEGDGTDGRVTVSSAGGGVEGNIQRWQGQFEGAPQAKTESKEVSGLKVTTAVIEGTYAGMAGAGGGPNFRMWGAVVQPPASPQLIFLKAVGPAKTMDKWDKTFEAFLTSMKAH